MPNDNNAVSATQVVQAADLQALRAAAEAAGPQARAALIALLAEVADGEQMTQLRIETLEGAAAACGLADRRIGALEQLIAGYRRTGCVLVNRLRERQHRDPFRLTDALAALRTLEDAAILAAHQHDAWALRVVTEGEACPEARPAWDAGRDLAGFGATTTTTATAAGVDHA